MAGLNKCCYSRIFIRKMFKVRRFHNALFGLLVGLFCLTIYNKQSNSWDAKDTSELLSEEIDSQESYMSGRKFQELNERTQHLNNEEEVDIVYTWVNGSDPDFIRNFEQLMKNEKKSKSDIVALNRYNDWGTLKYSLRSVEKFLPWIRQIFIVTNGQIPYWLTLNNPRISVVMHEEIFENRSHLPAFTSPAIECHIHKIHGLSKRFIYMNDDIIITKKLQFSDFYSEKEGHKLRFIQERLEHCNALCPANNVNNGICEVNCTTASCEFDGDDCKRFKELPAYPGTDKDFLYDSWSGSLRHTHFILNKAFGPRDRYIPEHAAILIDKDLFADLIKSFREEWEITSSTKIRHHLTIQPEFAYYNYLIILGQSRAKGVKTTRIWTKKNAEKIDFFMDDRGRIERLMQYKLCRRELLLKQPKFLVFSDHFNRVLYDAEKREIQDSLRTFLQNMFPKASEFELK
ncbi:N-acetylglucosamine-1-phosphotransferase subunits alpha/beta-like [Mercenaria mercenaria]|uniref:N-acetylglucosamine-1-phosphotransferase subunits alpha/beta-like n=1 Tax=Mercenaria mercenaria TaxID=6596 RepID=UPI00234F102A|nr:N-acetylglucosamine-1-phosphotransferase subunits alpha/beta-like [Mercenaria mercenaria]